MSMASFRGVKEKILDDVEHAVRQIHLCEGQDHKGGEGDVLERSGTSMVCQQLDFALLHGLRKISLGYWAFVREFSHKSLIETVEGLQAVTTQIGRGRAWLYISLNEKLLASYLQSFINNPEIVNKYYLPYAVVRDDMLVKKLMALVGKLEGLDFDLNADCPFLDAGLFSPRVAEPCLQSETSLSQLSEASSPGDSGVAFPDSDMEVANRTEDEVDSRHHEVQDNHINCLLALRMEDVGSSSAAESISSLPPATPRQTKPQVRLRRKKAPTEPAPSFIGGNLLYSSGFASKRVSFQSEPQLGPRQQRVARNRHSWCFGDQNAPQPPLFPAPTPLSHLAMVKLGERGIPEGQEDPPVLGSGVMAQAKRAKEDRKSDCTRGPKLDIPLYFPGTSVDPDAFRAAEQETEMAMEAACRHASMTTSVQPSQKLLSWFQKEVGAGGVTKEHGGFWKAFVASCGHAKGKPKPLLALLTKRQVYVVGLEERSGTRRTFRVCFSLPYLCLDFILVGPDAQWVRLTSRDDKPCSFKLDLRDHETALELVSCLELGARRLLPWPPHPLSLPSAIPLPLTMNLVMGPLRKWVGIPTAEEEEEEEDEDEGMVLFHGLVHLEDVQASPPVTPLGPLKDGHLMGRKKASQEWEPVYVILKAGVLYQFDSPANPMPKVLLPLFSQDCNGCRRISTDASGRPHTFEILWKTGGYQFAAADEYEASEWLQAFLQAMEMDSSDTRGPPPSPCVLVLLRSCIVAYQEGTSGVRPLVLALAPLESVVRVSVHRRQCCLLEVECTEAHHRTGDWILYFASPTEMGRFLGALQAGWEQVFQDLFLPVGELENRRLADRCEEKFWLLTHPWEEMLEEPVTLS